MPTASLHDDGWRQGSLIRSQLTTSYLDSNGAITDVTFSHGLWLLATQDCDLAQTKLSNSTKLFELRPVFESDGTEVVDGIRSRVVRVAEKLILRADSPRITLTARALNQLKTARENSLSTRRRREIKTWLGLRYDRPAVPTDFTTLSSAICDECRASMPIDLKGKIRDVLLFFHDQQTVDIWVITHDASARNAAIDWIDGVIERLADRVGIITQRRDVEASNRTPFSVVETYYGLFSDDLSLTQG